MRAVVIQKNSDRTMTVARMLPASPMTVCAHGWRLGRFRIRISTTSNGSAMNRSVTRIIALSSFPPK